MVEGIDGLILSGDGTVHRVAPGEGDCWRHIGVTGDRSCPELSSYVHCRNCPVFAKAARTFFDRPAPDGYLDGWSRWLAVADGQGASKIQNDAADSESERSQDKVSVLIFRLGAEWLAFRTRTVAEVTTPRPVHRVPHRTNQVFLGLVSVQGQVQLCVSLYGLLGAAVSTAGTRLVVLRDSVRTESWAFVAEEVLGVHLVSCDQRRSIPATLANPAVGYSQAVFSWKEHSVGLLDEERIFSALRSLEG